MAVARILSREAEVVADVLPRGAGVDRGHHVVSARRQAAHDEAHRRQAVALEFVDRGHHRREAAGGEQVLGPLAVAVVEGGEIGRRRQRRLLMGVRRQIDGGDLAGRRERDAAGGRRRRRVERQRALHEWIPGLAVDPDLGVEGHQAGAVGHGPFDQRLHRRRLRRSSPADAAVADHDQAVGGQLGVVRAACDVDQAVGHTEVVEIRCDQPAEIAVVWTRRIHEHHGVGAQRPGRCRVAGPGRAAGERRTGRSRGCQPARRDHRNENGDDRHAGVRGAHVSVPSSHDGPSPRSGTRSRRCAAMRGRRRPGQGSGNCVNAAAGSGGASGTSSRRRTSVRGCRSRPILNSKNSPSCCSTPKRKLSPASVSVSSSPPVSKE